MPEPISLREAIAILPNNASGVLDLLHALGIRGYRGSTTDCPLAVWLTRRTGRQVMVWPDQVVAENGEHCNLPFHLQMFIEQLDHNNLEGGEAILSGV